MLVGGREDEQVVDEEREAVDLGRGARRDETALLQRAVLGEPVEQHADRRQRAAQLVPGIGDEGPA